MENIFEKKGESSSLSISDFIWIPKLRFWYLCEMENILKKKESLLA